MKVLFNKEDTMQHTTKTILVSILTPAVLIFGLSGTASAANIDADVAFTGTILDSCVVAVVSPGTLDASTDQTVLSSRVGSGQDGQATVTTNSTGSTIEVLAPTAFLVAPTGSDANTLFEAKYWLSGQTATADLDGTVATSLGLGLTNISVGGRATKSTGTYTAGAYSMLTTVRCVTP